MLISFRYTSLVRRNFIRFGKRNGIVIDNPNGMTKEMEKNENLDTFLDLFKHFEALPVHEEIKDEKWSPIREELLQQPVDHPEKRARDFIRFGKRSPEIGYDYYDESEMYDYPDEGEIPMLKRSPKRRKMANYLRFGRK